MAVTNPVPESGTVYNRDLRELVLDGEVDFDFDRPVYTYCLDHTDINRPSLAVYADHAYCYTCRKYYSPREFSKRFTSMEMTAAKLRAGRAHSRARAPSVDPGTLAMAAHSMLLENEDKELWLRQRGLDSATTHLYQLGHNGLAYTLPLFDSTVDRNITAVRFRRDDTEMTDGHKYWGLRGLNQPMWYPFTPQASDEYVLLTEGEFDALLLRQHLLNAYSITNGCEAGFDLVAKAPVPWVILCRDQDEAGETGTEKLVEYLGEHAPEKVTTIVRWRLTSGKDITEVWQHDPALFERVVEGIKQMIREAK